MSFIISIIRDMNSKSLNIEIYYSYLYFRDKNRELLDCQFCSKDSIYIKIE